MLWLGFIFVFLGLVGVRIASKSEPAIAITGSELFAPAANPKQKVTGTFHVLRSRTDDRNNKTLKLEAPDRSQVTLVIPGNVDTQRPDPGSTIQVTAKRLGTGSLTLENHQDIKILTPGSSSLRRETLAAYLHITGPTSKGGLTASLYDRHDEFIAVAVVLPDCADEAGNRFATLYGYFAPDNTFIVEDIR